MVSYQAKWVRWAPINAVVNNTINYGELTAPGGIVGFEEEFASEFASTEANGADNVTCVEYPTDQNVTLTLENYDCEKLVTATRMRAHETLGFVYDPNKVPARVGVALVDSTAEGSYFRTTKYRCTVYPMVSFKYPKMVLKSNAKDVEFESTELEGRVFNPPSTYPKIQKIFDTEAEAIVFGEGLLGRRINLQLNLGDGHVENQAEVHQLNRNDVPAGRQIVANAIAEGLAHIVPPEGLRLIGWALQPGGEVVQFINPGLGLAMQDAAQQIYAIYERAQENQDNQGD